MRFVACVAVDVAGQFGLVAEGFWFAAASPMAVVVTAWVAVRVAAGMVRSYMVIEVRGGWVVVVAGVAGDGPLATVSTGTEGGFAGKAGWSCAAAKCIGLLRVGIPVLYGVV